MASDWIIVGALAILAAIVFLLYRSVAEDADGVPGPKTGPGKGRDSNSGATTGN